MDELCILGSPTEYRQQAVYEEQCAAAAATATASASADASAPAEECSTATPQASSAEQTQKPASETPVPSDPAGRAMGHSDGEDSEVNFKD